MFTWLHDDPEALVVWVDSNEEKDAMIGGGPHKFFTTDHYDGHPIVFVNLDHVDGQESRELITESWRLRAPKTHVEHFDADHA